MKSLYLPSNTWLNSPERIQMTVLPDSVLAEVTFCCWRFLISHSKACAANIVIVANFNSFMNNSNILYTIFLHRPLAQRSFAQSPCTKTLFSQTRDKITDTILNTFCYNFKWKSQVHLQRLTASEL